MNLSEFKAWFEGFTENLDVPPGEKAWTKIQAKVKEITDTPATSYPVFVDRYVRRYPAWWEYQAPYQGPTWISHQNATNPGLQASANAGLGYENMQSAQNLAHGSGTVQWNSSNAFRDLGRVDAQSLAA